MKKGITILGIVAMVFTANAQTNLIVNPGFENWTGGKPDGWSTPAGVEQSSVIKHSGNYSLGVTSASGTQTSGATDISVTTGHTYVFKGWYLDNVANGRMKYFGQWRDGSGAIVSPTPNFDNMQQQDYSTDSPEWKQFSVEAMPPTGAITMRASVRVYKDSDGTFGGKVYFDDIEFYDKASMGTIDVKAFDAQVKMNTIVKNDLTLRLPSRATVNVYSVDGKLMSSNRLNDGDTINMSSFAKGMYVVSVQDNAGNKISRKVIKD